MQDPNIISNNQITTSDITSQVSSLRTLASEPIPFSTTHTQLNITIVMTNPSYPSSPQIGKIDFSEQDSTNVISYEVYVKLPGSNIFTPFNSNPSIVGPEIFNVDDNVIFPDGVFVDEIMIIVYKDTSAFVNSDMTFKVDVFACFVLLGNIIYIICI